MSLFPLLSGRIVSSNVEFVDASSGITAPENLLFVEMPGEAEASLGNSMESVYYPSSQGDGSGQDTVSSVFILPNFGEFEVIHITSHASSFPNIFNVNSVPALFLMKLFILR